MHDQQDLRGFETLISELSSRFIDLPVGEVDRTIEEDQRRVCEVLDVDLSALWEGSAAAPQSFVLTHFYGEREDLLPPMRGMLAEEYFPWFLTEVLQGRTVAVSRLDELPREAALDGESLRRFGVRSILVVPLAVGGAEPVGALAFNSTRGEHEWPDGVVSRLRLVAQVFATVLARKRGEEALRESEERARLAADSAEAGIWELDYATGEFWVSPRTEAIFGLEPDETLTVDSFLALVHPDDRMLLGGAIERTRVQVELAQVEYRIVTRRGELKWLSSRGKPHFAPSGKPVRLMGVTLDESPQRLAREALRTSEARLKAGAELADLGFYEVDFAAGTMYADERLRGLCGVPPECRDLEVLEYWRAHIHPYDQDRVEGLRQELHQPGGTRLSFEYRFLHAQRGERWMLHLADVTARDASGIATGTFGVLRDITDDKRAEAELKDLSHRLIRAQEEERALLARELHDDVSQRLAVLAIDAGRAELEATEVPHVEALRAVREGLVSLSEDVHSLAYQLHPSVLEELGLVEALRTECERRGRHGGFAASVNVGEVPRVIPREQALCLFRVAQEALNNVARHARASKASITLRPSDGGLLLAVTDDGDGFDLRHDADRGRRLGLASMRERVELVSGTLDVESALGEGTIVLAWVPLEEARRDG